MSILKRIFGGKPPPRLPEESAGLSRHSIAPGAAASGAERITYIQKCAAILGRDLALDLSASLQQDYGCADLDISELVQIAEETWDIGMMPNPMQPDDFAVMMRRFRTIQSIIDEAERIASERR